MCSWLLLYYTIFFLLQQGACIVSLDKRVMAVGFSGYPEGTNPEEIKEKVKVQFGREIDKNDMRHCNKHNLN